MPFSFIPGWRVWQAFLGRLFPFHRKPRRQKQRRTGFHLKIEMLEDRMAPAVFNVPSGTEPGTNISSLSAAINLADSNSDAANIINLAPGS